MAIAPAIFLLVYYYKQDSAKPEPKGLIFKIFMLGFASIIPAIIIELIVDSFVNVYAFLPIFYYLLKSFFVAALVEESLKLFIVKKFAYNDVHFDEVMDGIVYTVVASLGFACFENVLYVMGSDWEVAILRAFTAVPLHAISAGIMGFYIGKAKFANSYIEERSLIMKGFWFAIIFHGVYDFLIFSMPVFGMLSGLLVIPQLIFGFIFLRKKIKLAIAEDIQEGRTLEVDYDNIELNENNYASMSRAELRRRVQHELLLNKEKPNDISSSMNENIEL